VFRSEKKTQTSVKLRDSNSSSVIRLMEVGSEWCALVADSQAELIVAGQQVASVVAFLVLLVLGDDRSVDFGAHIDKLCRIR
jgi:hypothetical protein